MKWWDQISWYSFFEYWVLSQVFTLLFHPHQEALQFLLTYCRKGGIICMSDVVDISPHNLDSSLYFISLAFCMMYSAYKLNKKGDSVQPWCTSFPIWNQSIVPFLVLIVASWPSYRFLKRQVSWSGIPISWRIFHSLLWSTQSKALA